MCVCGYEKSYVCLTSSLVEPLGLKEEDRVGISDGGQQKTLGLTGTSWNHHLIQQYIASTITLHAAYILFCPQATAVDSGDFGHH